MLKEKTDINAQIKLLDDPDNSIFDIVKQSLLNQGKDIIPDLEKAWESSFNELVQVRIENIIQRIQIKSLCNELYKWVFSENHDLIEGACIVAKLQYPELNLKDIYYKIDTIVNDIWIELNDNLTAFEKIKILNHVIFDEYKFLSNEKYFNSAPNTYLNNLLDTKRGNALSISILYAGIAQKLSLPIYPIDLPMNYVLAYNDDLISTEAFGEEKNTSVLFYINPNDNGSVFGKLEIDYFLKKQEISPLNSYYLPCDNLYFIKSMIKHLIFLYQKSGSTEKINDLKEILRIAEAEK